MTRPSKAALGERQLRLAPKAMDTMEGILAEGGADGVVYCPTCSANVTPACPDCKTSLSVGGYKDLHLKAAQAILGGVGLGPMQRLKVEPAIPQDVRGLILELRACISEMGIEERELMRRELFPSSEPLQLGDGGLE